MAKSPTAPRSTILPRNGAALCAMERVGEEDEPSSPAAGEGLDAQAGRNAPRPRADAIGHAYPCRSDDRGYDRALG